MSFSADYAWIQKKLLNELDIPYAIIDEEGRILWMNDQFTQIVKEEKGKLKTLSAMFPDITKENLMNLKENASIHSTFGESCYRVELKPVTIGKDDINPESGQEVLVEDRSMITVYLFDETEILRLSQEVNDQKMVAGLIYLDNYEEALASVEEVRRSLLMALIERKISKYITGMCGIVKRWRRTNIFLPLSTSTWRS